MQKPDKKVLTLLILALLVSAAITSFISFTDDLSERFEREEEDNDKIRDGEKEEEQAEDESEQKYPEGVTQPSHDLDIDPEGEQPSSEPLFKVKGASDTEYLKNSIGIEYTGDVWKTGESAEELYTGERLEHDVHDYTDISNETIEIEPIVEFEPGYIPVPMFTERIRFEPLIEDEKLFYDPEMNVFRSQTDFTHEYRAKATQYDFDVGTLRDSDPIEDEKYYQLPDAITQRTFDLADEITEGKEGAYEKAEAIQIFLIENYYYDLNYNVSPEDIEPVDWFLFEEKKGVSSNFNSAFVVLARAAEVPARLVSGFNVPDSEENVTVRANNAHTRPEIGLEAGWIEFDSTGQPEDHADYDDEIAESERISTRIDIDSVYPDMLKRGENLDVEGTVKTLDDQPLDDIQVSVLIEDVMVEIARGHTRDGRFDLEAEIPKNLDVGEYRIIARAFTDEGHWGDWTHRVSRAINSYDTNNRREEHKLRIYSETEIELEHSKYIYPGGELDLDGRLTDDQGNNLTNTELRLEIESNQERSIISGEDGTFSTTLLFSELGNHSFQMIFNGTEFYEETSKRSEIKVQNPTIDLYDDLYFIRGEKNMIEGRVNVNETPVADEIVSVHTENGFTLNSTTDDQGLFYHEFDVEENADLELVDVTWYLSDFDTSKDAEIPIRSATSMSMDVEEVQEDEYRIKVSLVDDSGEALEEKDILFNASEENFDQKEKTTGDGTAIFFHTLSDDAKGEVEFDVRFEGTTHHQDQNILKTLDVEEDDEQSTFIDRILSMDTSKLESILILLPIIVGLSAIGYALKSGRIKKETTSLFKADKKPKEDISEGGKNEIIKKDKVSKKLLSFPQIEEKLPNVWGVNEDLIIKIKDEKNNDLELYINDEEEVLNRKKEHHHKFSEKGKHEIKVIGPGVEQVIKLRVVDYRREIEREYGKFLKELDKNGFDIYNRTTPRKLYHRLVDNIEKKQPLARLTEKFEKARYSPESISRKDYVEIFLSKLEMRRELGWKTVQ